MVYSKIALREIRKRPGRAILTLLSIVIGVAAVAPISIASRIACAASDAAEEATVGKVDLEVWSPIGNDSFDESVVEKLRNVLGVKEVVPLLRQRFVVYAGVDQNLRAVVIATGVDPKHDLSAYEYTVSDGKTLNQDLTGVLLDGGLAQHLGTNVGDLLGLVTRRGFVRPKVVGLYTSRDLPSAQHVTKLVLPLRAAQYLAGKKGKIDLALIVLQPGVDETAVKSAVGQVLPSGLSVRRPEALTDNAEVTDVSTVREVSTGAKPGINH